MSEEPLQSTSSAPSERRVTSQPPRRGMEILFFLGVFALWIILQVWVLPKLGVPT
jgi:hypothetical protein